MRGESQIYFKRLRNNCQQEPGALFTLFAHFALARGTRESEFRRVSLWEISHSRVFCSFEFFQTFTRGAHARREEERGEEKGKPPVFFFSDYLNINLCEIS